MRKTPVVLPLQATAGWLEFSPGVALGWFVPHRRLEWLMILSALGKARCTTLKSRWPYGPLPNSRFISSTGLKPPLGGSGGLSALTNSAIDWKRSRGCFATIFA